MNNTFTNPAIRKMKTYAPPLDGRRKFKGVLCDFNECTIPVCPAVSSAIRKFADKKQVQIYPEYGEKLIKKIAEYCGVAPDQVLLTNGSDQGIDLIFRSFLTEKDKVVIPSPSFAMFYQCAGIIGSEIAEPVYQLPNLSYPTTEVINEIESGAKLVVICNPNNPTGTLLSLREIEFILKKALENSCVVYIDEAYYEFSKTTAAGLIDKYPNLLITRTFSKAFGLPSLRIGYVLSCAENIMELQKVRGPYDVNMVACEAALASLSNLKNTQKYANEVVNKAKPIVEDFFRKQKILFYPSGSNFLLFKPKNTKKTYEILKKNGFLTRPRSGPNIDRTLRLTIGTVTQMKKFIRIFKEKILVKTAFLDRDGTLIYEPRDTFQIDSIAKLRVLPGVIKTLKKLIKNSYKLILVSNQDGLGSPSFPRKDFLSSQNMMLKIFRRNGILFSEIFICPHLKNDNCDCRKPKLGLIEGFLQISDIDYERSFVCGDRDTDQKFASNAGLRFVKTLTNSRLKISLNF